MSKHDKKSSGDFASNLFNFLEEEETQENLAGLKDELHTSGIDPDTETQWVNEYVTNQIRMMKEGRIQAASEARTTVLDRLKSLKRRGSGELTALVDRLFDQIQSGQLQGLEAMRAQFSKLENPTEEDLRSLLADWVEMDKWDDTGNKAQE